jgi:hypothetical protein
LLKISGNWVPPDWDERRFGVGIVDAEALLRAPLPNQASLDGAVGAFAAEAPSGTARLAAAFGELDEDNVATRVENLGLDQKATDRFVPELLVHLLSDPVAAESFIEHNPVAPGAFEHPWIDRLRARAIIVATASRRGCAPGSVLVRDIRKR